MAALDLLLAEPRGIPVEGLPLLESEGHGGIRACVLPPVRLVIDQEMSLQYLHWGRPYPAGVKGPAEVVVQPAVLS